MTFAKNLVLENINPEWAEKSSGYKQIAEVLIRFVPIVTTYDAESGNSKSFSFSLNLSLTPELKTIKSMNENGEKVTEKKYKKEGHVKKVLRSSA